MTPSLHAAYYADSARQVRVEIIEQEELACDTWRLRFAAPEFARAAVPGQFFMIRVANCDDPLLGRPLALYRAVPPQGMAVGAIDVVYLVKGKFTRRLVRCRPGDALDVWGPLGNGFPPANAEQLVLVAGGIGQTPFFSVAAEALGRQSFGDPVRPAPHVKRVVLCYGARNASYLAGLHDFNALGIECRLATDDGSAGHRGLVTELLPDLLTADSVVYCCGPEPMMAAVTKMARDRAVRCLVSLETPMACGIGICFTCVARVCDENGVWDYKRTCVEGPIFDGASIAW